jgi:hypothetical protein
MEIRNVTQFANFLESNGLQTLDGGFVQTIACVKNFSVACNCYKVEDKQKIYKICCNLYINSVTQLVPKFKNAILQKIPEGRISFYNDNGGLIAIVSR